LKRALPEGARQEALASPASNGGRGLKQAGTSVRSAPRRIARQQWRARIETRPSCALCLRHGASPASNGGRGLKLHLARTQNAQRPGIARQQWRARIETRHSLPPGPRAGRIARQQWRARIETAVQPQ